MTDQPERMPQDAAPAVKQGKYKDGTMIAGWFNRRFMRSIAAAVGTGPFSRVLDIGCGEGIPLLELQPVFGKAELHGIDPDQEAVDLIRRNMPDGHFQKGSAYELPYADNHFDLVLCLEALEHMDRPEKALSEIARVGNGTVILSVPREPWWGLLNILRFKYLTRLGNPPEHIQRWTRRGFRKLAAGFLDIKKVRTVLPWTILESERSGKTST
ncbi:class I SAM-dependent methyltransferase [Planctomycetota bacterium]